MIEDRITQIPIADIFVPNPRPRDQLVFKGIVENIRLVGLKKPILVSRRRSSKSHIQYDLICGQGRLEAFQALGETTIPAIISNAPKQDRFLMSVVENVARRAPSEHDIIREIRGLQERGFSSDEIAIKVGLDKKYVKGLIYLLDHGEHHLIGAVEAGRLPITIALTIVRGTDDETQRALAEAYESGLRGYRLAVARRVIANRQARLRKKARKGSAPPKVSVDILVREYQQQTKRQRELLARATLIHDRLLVLKNGIKHLLSDEHFVTLLRAESLTKMPLVLAEVEK